MSSINDKEKYKQVLYFMVGYMFIFICRPLEEYKILSNLRLELVYVLIIVIYVVIKKISFSNLWIVDGKIPILLMFGVIIMSGLVANDIAEWANIVDKYFKYLVFYFLLIAFVRTEDDFFFIIKSYISLLLLYEVLCLREYFVFGRHEYRMGIKRLIGIGSSFSDPNAVAASINYSLPFAYALFLVRKTINLGKIYTYSLYLYLTSSLVCIILTGSRSGFVCFVIALALMSFRSRRKLVLYVSTILIGSLVWSLVPEEKQMRIETLYDTDAGPSNAKYSAESRYRGFYDGLLLFKENPLLGVGAGNFMDARVRKNLMDGALQAHNLYGQTLGELGAAGVIAFFLLLISLLRYNLFVISSSHSTLHEFSWACVFSIIIMLINGFGSHNLYRYNWIWITAFSGIMLSLVKKNIQNNDNIS